MVSVTAALIWALVDVPAEVRSGADLPVAYAVDAASRMPCPRCGESIPTAARVCRFCGHELGPVAPQ